MLSADITVGNNTMDPHAIMETQTRSVVMLGASGAVGGIVARRLATVPWVRRLTLLNRRPLEGISGAPVAQHVVDVTNPDAYSGLLPGHDCAVCCLGVGQPSKMSREEFRRVDHDAVLGFAKACAAAGVRHFELLGSVGAQSGSRSYYLKTKGELQDAIVALGFDRVSFFQPSMILTPTNRYGFSQALVLALWPILTPLLAGTFRKYRGIRVEALGRAIADNLATNGHGVEILQWDQMMKGREAAAANEHNDTPGAAQQPMTGEKG